MEEWRPIPSFPGYEVSDLGRVRSWKQHNRLPIPHALVGHPVRNGYLAVSLHVGAMKKTRRIHQLVLLTFTGPRNDGMATRHLNGDKLDNRLRNLAYGSTYENNRDTVAHGHHRKASQTCCMHGHPFDEANTRIRRNGTRECKACQAAHQRRLRARRRAERHQLDTRLSVSAL